MVLCIHIIILSTLADGYFKSCVLLIFKTHCYLLSFIRNPNFEIIDHNYIQIRLLCECITAFVINETRNATLVYLSNSILIEFIFQKTFYA